MNCSDLFINTFLYRSHLDGKTSENIISQLMGFYFSAALVLPRSSWFSLISFFKMTSKQRIVLGANNQISSCLYCFMHTMKRAHRDCMRWLCVWAPSFMVRSARRQSCVKICYMNGLCVWVAGTRIKFNASACACVLKKCRDMREMEMARDRTSESIKGREMEGDENGCAVILVVLAAKFSVWTESDEAGHKPPGWISEIKVPRSLLSHHIPYHQGGIHLLTQKDGAAERAEENWHKMESKSLSGGFVGIESSGSLWGSVVLRRDDTLRGDTAAKYTVWAILTSGNQFSFLFGPTSQTQLLMWCVSYAGLIITLRSFPSFPHVARVSGMETDISRNRLSVYNETVCSAPPLVT